jgi:large conductance mechanosensitive channel
MLKGFRDFLLRGNVIELAVAVAIGTAFTTVVEQFGKSFINPLVNLAGGGKKTGGMFHVRAQTFDWGAFVNAVIFFAITATVIYFVIMVPMQRISSRLRRSTAEEETPPLPPDIELLTEIRDLLRSQARD